MKKLKRIPHFKNDEQEFKFWASHDVSDYADLANATKVTFPNLKPTTRLMAIRLPISIIERLKALAHQRDVPYQSLMKVLLNRAISQEARLSR